MAGPREAAQLRDYDGDDGYATNGKRATGGDATLDIEPSGRATRGATTSDDDGNDDGDEGIS